jgi:two-component system, chemotaxis family, chemotaxis protein CheY
MSQRSILIVDDSHTVRLYYRRSLETSGFLVRDAHNGVEGLELVLSAKFDLLIVDVNMPKMDGYEFVRTVRGEPHFNVTPVVMITSERDAKDKRNAYRSGANLYVVKPVRAHELAELARLVTGGAQ